MIEFELTRFKKGEKFIAGIDEVGRGALAGPMVVCAVILNSNHLLEYNNLPADLSLYTQINDSKQLTPNKRRLINTFLNNVVISYSLIEMTNIEIDTLGISECTQISFLRAIKNLTQKPEFILTDSFEIKKISSAHQQNIIKGDTKSITIAAASIMAKVYRDDLMTKIHNDSEKYKVYNFDKHKGYGTKQHIDSIRKYGLSDLHRKSYQIKTL